MLRHILIVPFIAITSIQSTQNCIKTNKTNIIQQTIENHPKKALVCGTTLIASGLAGLIYCELNNKNPFLQVLPMFVVAGGLYVTLESAFTNQTPSNKNTDK